MKEKYDIEKELSLMEKVYNWQYYTDIEIEGTIQGAIDWLSEYNSDDYKIDKDWDDLCLKVRVIETDREFEDRKNARKRFMESENLKFDSKEEKERAKFERLKAAYEILKEKFEPNN
jgi:hypothetical protein